jgi:hypothetical protein
MSETSQPKDIFKHSKGSFERLNGENYPSWKINCRYLLLANDEWDIVTGDEVAPEIPPNGNSLQIGVATGLLKDFRKRRQDATYIIHNSCSEFVHAHINQTDDPKVMWNALAKIYDTANETVGRQSLFRDFSRSGVVQQEGLHKGRRSLRRKPHCWSTETKSCWSMLEELRDGVHIISKRQHQCNFLATVKTKGKKLKELLRDLSEPRHLTIMDEHALNKQIPTM